VTFAPRFTISNKLTASMTRIERARGFLEAAKLSEDWIRRMGDRALVLEAHHTTHIEGTRLTLEQAGRLWAGERVPEADPDDARELLNYRAAFDLVSQYVGGGAPITEGLLREIHKRLVEGVRGNAAAPGEYRRVQNYVVNSATGDVVYTPPPAIDVPILVQELVVWLNEEREVHPSSRAVSRSSSSFTSTRSSTGTAAPRASSRRSTFTGRDTTSNAFSRSASFTTAIARRSTAPSRACATAAWISLGGSSTSPRGSKRAFWSREGRPIASNTLREKGQRALRRRHGHRSSPSSSQSSCAFVSSATGPLYQ
jgi:hypothetical protein